VAVRRRALILAAALAAGLAGCERKAAPQASFKGVDITGAEYANALDLPDVDGRERHLADFEGKATVVFFGYTQCPDVCPTTLAEIAEVKRRLGADGARVQGVFVTVDPERDTAEVLKAYVGNFGADFLALRGTPEQTKAAAKNFKVYFNKVPGQTAGSYTIDHTAGAYLFDTQGRVRVFTRYGGGAAALEHDLRLLLGLPAPAG
jgi:protein SCO1/2